MPSSSVISAAAPIPVCYNGNCQAEELQISDEAW
jgi:hypothetical protein